MSYLIELPDGRHVDLENATVFGVIKRGIPNIREVVKDSQFLWWKMPQVVDEIYEEGIYQFIVDGETLLSVLESNKEEMELINKISQKIEEYALKKGCEELC